MLIIRLSRIGRTNYPSFRIIVSEKARDTKGTYLELLGNYNPRTKVCDVKKERVLYWISKGSQMSPRIHNLFVDQNVISVPKLKIHRTKKKKGEDAAPEIKKAEAKKIAAEPAKTA